MAGNESVRFFDAQFRRQAAAGEFALNPFEERALPYLICFPEKETAVAQEPMPEGLGAGLRDASDGRALSGADLLP